MSDDEGMDDQGIDPFLTSSDEESGSSYEPPLAELSDLTPQEIRLITSAVFGHPVGEGDWTWQKVYKKINDAPGGCKLFVKLAEVAMNMMDVHMSVRGKMFLIERDVVEAWPPVVAHVYMPAANLGGGSRKVSFVRRSNAWKITSRIKVLVEGMHRAIQAVRFDRGVDAMQR